MMAVDVDTQSSRASSLPDGVATGVALAVSSSLFIGASFIVKKKGLRLAAASTSARASANGYSYLRQPLWWAGFLTSACTCSMLAAALSPAYAVTVGEAANFAAYAFAPPAVVTPLGALSIVVAAVGAHVLLQERLSLLPVLGCALVCLGAVPLVLHAPPDVALTSLQDLRSLAAAPPFVLYLLTLLSAVVLLVRRVEPCYGAATPLPGIAICSLVGSLSVLLCKALGVALRLLVGGTAGARSPELLLLGCALGVCVTVQMAFLNKALDSFHTARVTPVYYALFTSTSLLASAVLFEDWRRAQAVATVTQLCGFGTMLVGVALLHNGGEGEGGGGALQGPPRPVPGRGEEEGRRV